MISFGVIGRGEEAAALDVVASGVTFKFKSSGTGSSREGSELGGSSSTQSSNGCSRSWVMKSLDLRRR